MNLRSVKYGLAALVIEGVSVGLEVLLRRHERAEGWVRGSYVFGADLHLRVNATLLLMLSAIVAAVGAFRDARREWSILALFLFFVLLIVTGGLQGIG